MSREVLRNFPLNHKIGCNCCVCKRIRGEIRKRVYYCIEKNCNKTVTGKNRRCKSCETKRRYSLNLMNNTGMLGRKHSEKSKKKSRVSNLGQKRSDLTKKRLSESHKNQIPWIKNKHHSEKTKKKIRNSNWHTNLKAENHWNWQDGKSFEPYPLGWTKTFKEQIRYRDGYKCQICGKPEVECCRKLDVHHIDYNKENLGLDNLISLCCSCHMKTNGNRKYWKKYLMESNNGKQFRKQKNSEKSSIVI